MTHAREVLVLALEAAGYVVFWDAKLNNDDWKGELRDDNQSLQARHLPVVCEGGGLRATSRPRPIDAFELKKLLSAPIEDKTVVPEYCKKHEPSSVRQMGRRRRSAGRKSRTFSGHWSASPAGPRRKREPSAPCSATIARCPAEFGDIPGAPDKLIGRDAELAMLRDAWASKPPKKVNAVVLHALGGAGKSALLRTFANELLAAGGGGASRIYGWSAYSQGSGEQKRADADSFISKALGDFGWQGELPKDPVERGRALAKLIQKERVLLLLDGLEPLQDAPNVNKGKFKDKGLAELIKLLAGQNPGLVVLTTRQEVPELEGFGSW